MVTITKITTSTLLINAPYISFLREFLHLRSPNIKKSPSNEGALSIFIYVYIYRFVMFGYFIVIDPTDVESESNGPPPLMSLVPLGAPVIDPISLSVSRLT